MCTYPLALRPYSAGLPLACVRVGQSRALALIFLSISLGPVDGGEEWETKRNRR